MRVGGIEDGGFLEGRPRRKSRGALEGERSHWQGLTKGLTPPHEGGEAITQGDSVSLLTPWGSLLFSALPESPEFVRAASGGGGLITPRSLERSAEGAQPEACLQSSCAVSRERSSDLAPVSGACVGLRGQRAVGRQGKAVFFTSLAFSPGT